MHPCRAVAHSRAIMDAANNRYDNREQSQRGKIAYDTKHAEMRRAIEELESPRGTDQDIRRAEI